MINNPYGIGNLGGLGQAMGQHEYNMLMQQARQNYNPQQALQNSLYPADQPREVPKPKYLNRKLFLLRRTKCN